ncbi:hypothetical protein, conserved [Eimeria maxima]|uniref:Uncharacterized protein n=1 Tax=Eimeria maxima TaxID=5804 RepID=U6M649_EIMMA|nr:hypothetical protein, conserved [Eimeria maxima]CDJ59692.1 hypothetical protein, conserved [Eimeria maxima]
MEAAAAPVSPPNPVLGQDQPVARPGSLKGNIRGNDRELRLDGTSNDDESPQVSDVREERRGRVSRYKKSVTASWGLGEGVSGRMTGAAILGLLLLSMSIPFAVYKMHQGQIGRQYAFDALPTQGREAGEQHGQQQAAASEFTEATVGHFDAIGVPVTQNLQATFLSLKHTSDHGLLLSVRDSRWDSVRKEFLADLDRVAEIPPSVFENEYKSEEILRRMMAMDLACLENAAVETKVAIDDFRATHKGGFSDELAEKFQENLQARRDQVRAAELWETAVVNDLLGTDPALKDSMLKLLLAVRSRATSCEYLTTTSAEILFPSESSARGHVEENRVYEGVAYLIKAGQLAASDNLIKTYVAPWLAIIFTSF